MNHPVDVITISREFGAGGSELAHAVGARLGWRVLDGEIVRLVAARLGIEVSAAEKLDEHPTPLLERFAAMLPITLPEAPVVMDPRDLPDPDAVAHAARDVFLHAVQSPPVVLVGHGGQSFFRDRPGTLHVRVVAPLADRVRRVCRRFGRDDRSAAAEVRHTDEDRRQYLRRHCDVDWTDPLLYDVQFNTGRVSIDAAADILTRLVEHGGSDPREAAALPIAPCDGAPSP